MRLGNLFTLRLPVGEAWKALLDVERMAPCVPGAQLLEATGDEYKGVVKVTVGAAVAEYRGSLRITEIDKTAHRIVVHATGAELRGRGQASATVTASLTPSGNGGTAVALSTDLTVGGKLSQFGAGVMTDVSVAVLNQFVQRLEHDLALVPAVSAPPAPAPPAPAPAQPRAEGAVPPVELPHPPSRRHIWAPVGLIGVLAGMAVVRRRRSRWALAAIGAGLVVAGQRASSSM